MSVLTIKSSVVGSTEDGKPAFSVKVEVNGFASQEHAERALAVLLAVIRQHGPEKPK